MQLKVKNYRINTFSLFLTYIILVAITVVYNLFVATKVWSYVAVNMFHLPPVGLWQMFAIAFLIRVIYNGYKEFRIEFNTPTNLNKNQMMFQ